MKEKINCPVCQKRAFDIRSHAKGAIWIELKCPHCRNIVQVWYDMQQVKERDNEFSTN